MEIAKTLTPLVNTRLLEQSQPQSFEQAGFADVLRDSLTKVNQVQIQAEKLTSDFAQGKNVELHQVMIATETASLALQLTVQIRNKVIEAYQEIMRMQV